MVRTRATPSPRAPGGSARRTSPRSDRLDWILPIVGVTVGLPLLGLCALTLVGPPSLETGAFALATAAFVGASFVPQRRYSRRVVLGALSIAAVVVAHRLLTADVGASVRTTSEPGARGGRLLDRIVPERDVAIGGSGLLVGTGMMPGNEPGLLDALRDGYSRMQDAEGPVPSPVVGTFLFGQSPDDHVELRVAASSAEPRPEAVVVFLHGFIGSVTLLCWQVAQAAGPLGMDVVCPSTTWRAEWAMRDGRAIVEATIARLRAEGARRVYLAGLSAGGAGASRLARSLDVDGVILISGASSGAPVPRVPVLVLHGRRDRMMRRGPALDYAERSHGEYAERPDAGHWLILTHHEWATERIRRWLAEREETSAPK